MASVAKKVEAKENKVPIVGSAIEKELDLATKFDDLKTLLSRNLIEDEELEEEKENESDTGPATSQTSSNDVAAPKSLALALNISRFDDKIFGKGSKREVLRKQPEIVKQPLPKPSATTVHSDAVIANMEEGMMNHDRSEEEVLARKKKRRGSDRKHQRRNSHGSHGSRKSHRSHGSQRSRRGPGRPEYQQDR